MILTPHLLFGAAIASQFKNPFLAISLAFLGHYLLDVIPHNEYPIENIKKKQWRKILPDISMVSTDFLLGIFLIFIFSNNQPIIYVCAFFSILSDGLNLLSLFSSNKILKAHNYFHHEKIHFLSNRELSQAKTQCEIRISFFWRVLTQTTVIIISIFLMT